MRVLFIYNPYNAKEVQLKDEAINNISSYVETVEAIDFQEVCEQFRVRTTPALIFIRDDFQGEELLTEDPDNAGKLRLVGELMKNLEDEELKIHSAETHRLDNVINNEVIKGQDALMEDMITRGLI